MTERAKRNHLERKLEALEKAYRERGREITELKNALAEDATVTKLPALKVITQKWADGWEWNLWHYERKRMSVLICGKKCYKKEGTALAAARKFLKEHNLEEDDAQ